MAFEIIWKSAIDVGWIWLWTERITGFGWPRPTCAVDCTVTRSEPAGGGWIRSEYADCPKRASCSSVQVVGPPAA